MHGLLSIRGNSGAMLQWEARVFAWAVITLTHHVLGKCRQYSQHSAMMDGVFADTTEPRTPLFPRGGRGSKAVRGEIRDDWLNQNRGPSWMAVCWNYWEATVGVNATAQWQQRAVTGSKKIKCIPFLNGGKGGHFMWGGKLPVIKNISWTCWGLISCWEQVVPTPTGRNASLLQLLL